MTTPWVNDILDQFPVGVRIKDILAKYDSLLEQDDIAYHFIRAIRQHLMKVDRWGYETYLIRYMIKLNGFERRESYFSEFASYLKIRSNAVNHFVKREMERINNPSSGICLSGVGKALQKLKGMKNVSADVYSHILTFLPPNPIHQIFSQGTKIADTWLLAGKPMTQYEFHFNCPMVYASVLLPRVTNMYMLTPYFPSISPTFCMTSFRTACLKYGVSETLLDEIEKRALNTKFPLVL